MNNENNIMLRSLVKRVVSLFTQNDLSVEETAKTLEISEEEVLACLNNRVMIGLIYRDKASKIIQYIEKKLRGKEEVGEKDNYAPLNLALISQDEAKQYSFLRHLSLTFRAKPETLSSLFQIEELALKRKLFYYNQSSENAFNYLYNNDQTDQNEVSIKVINYYNNLIKAQRNRDKEEVTHLLHLIDDTYASMIRQKKFGDKVAVLSDEEIAILINYQIKYSISITRMGKIFNTSYSNLGLRMRKYVADNPLLKERLDGLSSYYALNSLGGRNK